MVKPERLLSQHYLKTHYFYVSRHLCLDIVLIGNSFLYHDDLLVNQEDHVSPPIGAWRN